MVEFTKRDLMKTSIAASVGASVMGVASGEDGDTVGAPMVRGEIERFASTAFGAEVTGPSVLEDGTLIFSLQHPADSNKNLEPFREAGVGYVKGYRFDEDSDFEELSAPKTEEEQGKVRTAAGNYELLVQEKDTINGGSERFGVPQTPDGTPLDEFAGTKYSAFGNAPDMNQFVPTPDGDYDGYLYSNHESSPGTLTRMPLVQEDGELKPDLKNTVNLANTEALRSLGGTRINCYGDLSPWGTPVSAEEEYSHPRVSLGGTVGEMVEDTGVGRRGAASFFNRPNPSAIQGKVGDYYESGWFVQGFWALGGLELQAYYLGAEPVDQADDGTNDLTPLEGPYPNPYRYGRYIDFRNPDAGVPADVEPVKYYVMGRGAWEAPDIQNDQKTVYQTSDGANKGIYKFVADEEIPSYDDPADIAGTLYAPKVTNKEAAQELPPAKVDLELEWIPLGHATNGEVESWVAEYDDVDQVDYLETHAETNWEEDLDAALEEADREVIENGNQNYIPDEDIVEWAEQYEEHGPDGVDEDLRRVPFLETRAAAKEIGATIEFRKAEGIDSVDDATPGDYIYIGLSEVNDGMADSRGDIQLDRVDGGMVYRAQIEPDYNISTLEPAIVGPDATDPTNVSDDALLNVDNIYQLNDGRVLCCEDADQLGRSFPNDCLYVYTPDFLPGKGDDRGKGKGHERGKGKGHERGKGRGHERDD